MLNEVVIEGYVSGGPWTHSGDQFSRRGLGSYRDRQRPVTIVSVPTGQVTIILAMDVSRSMCATDIPPNRLEAAKAAALWFIQSQKSNTQIGVVAFAGFAELIQPPTTDQEV